MDIYPSRFLNDQRGVLGLWLSDFAGALILFGILSRVLEGTPVEILALPISVLALICLAPIRLKTRRKIIRDFCGFYFTKRKLYDPRQHSILS